MASHADTAARRSKVLRVSPDLVLPLNAVTSTFALLAKRRAGKSNAGRVMAEEMYAARLPFVAIDPIGAWWGLRYARDGKGKGLPIPIFGGPRGDVPLEATGGALIAELVAERRLTCILDLRSFKSKADRTRFLLDFAQTLLRLNTEPLHVFMEEAHVYIPQKPFAEETRLVAAWAEIVAQGGGKGLGCTLLTQRSARLNKDVLEQVDSLIALRTTGPRDRAAIEGWLREKDDDLGVVESLPSLKDGEAWVWSPDFLGQTKRFRFRLSHTFDSGATPKVGQSNKPPGTMADVDLGALRERMAETIERAKAEDPKALQARVRDLERQLRAKVPDAKPAPVKEDSKWRVRATSGEQALRQQERVTAQAIKAIDAGTATLRKLTAAFVDNTNSLAERLAMVSVELNAKRPMPDALPSAPTSAASPRAPVPARPNKLPVPSDDVEGFGKPHQRILDGLFWFESLGVTDPDVSAVAFSADYTVNGTFNNAKSRLHSWGFVKYGGNGTMRLTEEGRARANAPPDTRTTEAMHRSLLGRLPGPLARMMRVLLDKYPAPMSIEDLAAATNYTVNGTFNNAKSRLRTMGLADYPERGMIVAQHYLFPEGG